PGFQLQLLSSQSGPPSLETIKTTIQSTRHDDALTAAVKRPSKVYSGGQLYIARCRQGVCRYTEEVVSRSNIRQRPRVTIECIQQFYLNLKSYVFLNRSLFDDAYIFVVIRIESGRSFDAGHSS